MRISVRRIQELVAADFGVDPILFRSPGKRAQIARPRQYAMLLARELTPLSYPVIGKLFGRDHSTIMAGVRAAQRRVAEDRALALKLGARALMLRSEASPPQIDSTIIVEERT
jgi:chromosomal replication initiator protein